MESLYTFMQTIGSDMVSFLSGGYHEVLSRVDELYPDQPDWVDQGQQPGGKTQYDTDDYNGTKKPDGIDDDDDDTGYRASSSSSSSSSGSSSSRSRHSTGSGHMPNAASTTSASVRVSTSKEGVELRRMVSNFAAQAHLAHDLDPASLKDLRQEAGALGGARGLDQSSTTSFASSSGSSSSHQGSGPLSGPQATVSAVTAALVACAAFALGIAFQNQKAWAEMSSQLYSTAQYISLM